MRGSFRSTGAPISPTRSGSGTATRAATGMGTRWSWETRNFSENSYYRGAAEGLHLVERFTRSGPDTLTYEMTFTDPATWAAPWTAALPLKRRTQPIYEFACHEGNYSLVGMLRTARLEEAR